jgi:hypothetical protein
MYKDKNGVTKGFACANIAGKSDSDLQIVW